MIAGAIEVLRLAPQPVASIVIPGIGPEAVAAALLGALPDVFSHLEAVGVAAIGPPFARHHDAGPPGRLDLEAGLPVADGRIPETDTIRCGSLPGGDAAVAVHLGSYDGLPASVDALRAWCVAHGRVAAGGHWEYFVDDPATVAADRVRTRLVLPLADSGVS